MAIKAAEGHDAAFPRRRRRRGRGGRGAGRPGARATSTKATAVAELRLTGRPASPGLAAEPAVRAGGCEPRGRVASGGRSRARGASGCAAAIAGAIAELERGRTASRRGRARHPGIPDRHARATTRLSEAGASPRSPTAATRPAPGGAPSMRRSPTTRTPRTSISAPAPPTSPISATACCASLSGATQQSVPAGTVLVGEDLPPSRFLGIDWSRAAAIALAGGSPTSHVAMLARARGVPMVVGLGADVMRSRAASEAMVDGERGTLVLAPGDGDPRRARRVREAELRQRRGHRATRSSVARPRCRTATPSTVMINVAGPDELVAARSRDLRRHRPRAHRVPVPAAPTLPDEETQYRAYRRILEWAGGEPVTIRTLDAGGDKPITGLTLDGEAQPVPRHCAASACRCCSPTCSASSCARWPRAAVRGNLKVMLPMVTVPRELAQGRAHARRRHRRSRGAQGMPYAEPPLGIMVEVPAAAIAIDRFDAAFFSIGSNDLTQYVMAAARDIAARRRLADAADPAVLSLIARTRRAWQAHRAARSACAATPAPIRPSSRICSMRACAPCRIAPSSVGLVKAAIAGRARWVSGSWPTTAIATRSTGSRDYKRILLRVLDLRPSGTRQRLADALGKNRSFVSQITNPAYPVPIPPRHLEIDLRRLPLPASRAARASWTPMSARIPAACSSRTGRARICATSRSTCRISTTRRRTRSSTRC